jgi:hypothetical protein
MVPQRSESQFLISLGCSSYPFQRILQVYGVNVGSSPWPFLPFPASCPFRVRHIDSCPALYPEPVWLEQIALGQAPSLHSLRRCCSATSLFASFLGTMGLSDFPYPYIDIVLLGFTSRTRQSGTNTGSPGFRARCLWACMGPQTSWSPKTPRAYDVPGVAFRLI